MVLSLEYAWTTASWPCVSDDKHRRTFRRIPLSTESASLSPANRVLWSDEINYEFFVGKPEVTRFIRHVARRRQFFRCSLAASIRGRAEPCSFVATKLTIFVLGSSAVFLKGAPQSGQVGVGYSVGTAVL